MAHPFGQMPVSLGSFVGVLPMAATLHADSCDITLSALEVFDSAVSVRLLATPVEGFDPPKFDAPKEFIEQMLESHRSAQKPDDSLPDIPDFQRQWTGRLKIPIRLAVNEEVIASTWPTGGGSGETMWSLEYRFGKDIRSVDGTPVLLVAEPVWGNPFGTDWFLTEQAFTPKWSIPIDLTRLVSAKEIDAR